MFKSILSNVKSVIVNNASESVNLRKQIDSLRWTSQSDRDSILAQHVPGERKCIGKKAVQHLKRKDTIIERNFLQTKRIWISRDTRCVLLAYAILRGKSYLGVEQKNSSTPNVHEIAKVLRQHVDTQMLLNCKINELITLWIQSDDKTLCSLLMAHKTEVVAA